MRKEPHYRTLLMKKLMKRLTLQQKWCKKSPVRNFLKPSIGLTSKNGIYIYVCVCVCENIILVPTFWAHSQFSPYI